MTRHGNNNPPKITLDTWIDSVMDNQNLSSQAKHMAHVIYQKWNHKDNSCELTNSDFSWLTCMSKRTIQRHVSELQNIVENITTGSNQVPTKYENDNILGVSFCHPQPKLENNSTLGVSFCHPYRENHGLGVSFCHPQAETQNGLGVSFCHPKPYFPVIHTCFDGKTVFRGDKMTPPKGRRGGDYRGGEVGLPPAPNLLIKTLDPVIIHHQKKIKPKTKKPKSDSVSKKIKFTKKKIDDYFAEFWAHVPAGRRVGKPAAREAFEKMIKGTYKKIEAGTPEEIIAGMKTFNETAREKNTELEFIPHPTTWLHAGRWMDETSPDAERKIWGWWRVKGVDAYQSLGIDWWRNKLSQVRPNGVWPWEELGPPPGHPECLLPEKASTAYGKKYTDQANQLLTKHGTYDS